MTIFPTLAALSSVSLRRLEDRVSVCLLITEQYLEEKCPAFSLISFNIGGLFMAALLFSHHKNYRKPGTSRECTAHMLHCIHA